MQKFVTLFILFSTFAGPKCLFAQGGDHTFVEKGLAIETSGSMDVFNDDYNTKKAVLDKLVAPILEDIRFVDAISSPGNYKSQEHLRAEIIFLEIHSDIFNKEEVKFGNSVNTLSDALTFNASTNKFAFDCDTSSFVYLEVLEIMNKKFSLPLEILEVINRDVPSSLGILDIIKESLTLPVVLLVCRDHALIKWKFDDGSYMNWETTAGIKATDEDNKHYAANCTEVVPGSDAFYALFYNTRGDEKYGLQDYTGAIDEYSKAIELYPEKGTFYYNRGTSKLMLEDYAGAIADYKKSLELDPSPNIFTDSLLELAKEKLKESEAKKE